MRFAPGTLARLHARPAWSEYVIHDACGFEYLGEVGSWSGVPVVVLYDVTTLAKSAWTSPVYMCHRGKCFVAVIAGNELIVVNELALKAVR